MSKHTPGPWIAVGGWVEHPSDKRPDICIRDLGVMGQEGRSDAEICANAQLIFAAPDLLLVLKAYEKTLKIYGRMTENRFSDASKLAQYAISKAKVKK